MTTDAINQNSATFRLETKPAALPCDGLADPCENTATRHIVFDGPNYDRRPVYISTNLCAGCYTTYMSRREVTN